MADSKFCGSCGTELEASTRFCGNCGAAAPVPTPTPIAAGGAVPLAAQTVAEPNVAAPHPPTRTRTTAIVAAVAGAVIIAAIGTLFWIRGDDPDSAATIEPTLPSVSSTVASTPPATTAVDTPATTAPTTAPTTAVTDTTEPPASTPTTAPPTTAPPTTAPPTTVPARQPVALDPGDPATCGVYVGSGGALARIADTATGFDVALADELVRRVLGDTEICFVPLSAADRFVALQTGEVDVLVRGTSATISRDELADFTTPYFVDGASVVVRRDTNTGTDLAGLSVAVPAGTRLASELISRSSAASVVEFDDFVVAQLAFDAGEVDALAGDWSQLWRQYGGPDHRVVFLNYSIEPLAVFVAEGNRVLRDGLDGALREMIEDGTWTEIFVTELGVEPWYDPVLLFDLPPADR